MTVVDWSNKKIGDERYIVPSVFESFYSAWILLKPHSAPNNQFVTVKIDKTCVDLSVRNLKKAYGISILELEFDPLALYQLLLEKIELLQSQYDRLFRPIEKIYRDRDEIWFSDSLLKTLQKSLKWSKNSAYYSSLYTETPFSVSISKNRFILDTKREFPIDGHSSKNFHYSADIKYPNAPLLRLTSRDNNDDFEREWNIYNWILATYRESGSAPEGILIPWCLLTVGQNNIIYLPIGKPYVYIPLSPQQISIAISLIKGLQFLHSECLTHGDPKLKNFVLIDGKAKWFDFGSTAPFGTHLEHCYTQGYQAHEYFTDKDRNMVLLDVYALGVTLYEVHYGKRPPFVYDPFTSPSKKHLEWCELPTSYPLVKVIKGFMHPYKNQRMTLKEGLKVLEEVNRPTQVF